MRPKCQDTSPRQQSGIQFERGILGGRTHQNNGAVLHDRQKTVLLRTVETVNFVDEKQGLATVHAPCTRRFENLLEIGDAGKDR